MSLWAHACHTSSSKTVSRRRRMDGGFCESFLLHPPHLTVCHCLDAARLKLPSMPRLASVRSRHSPPACTLHLALGHKTQTSNSAIRVNRSNARQRDTEEARRERHEMNGTQPEAPRSDCNRSENQLADTDLTWRASGRPSLASRAYISHCLSLLIFGPPLFSHHHFSGIF